MTNPLVTAEHRNANTRAVRERAAWRIKYDRLSMAIRAAKARLVMAHRLNRFDPTAELELSALRFMAHDMMMHRNAIKCRLRVTSYPYADEAVTQEAA